MLAAIFEDGADYGQNSSVSTESEKKNLFFVIPSEAMTTKQVFQKTNIYLEQQETGQIVHDC